MRAASTADQTGMWLRVRPRWRPVAVAALLVVTVAVATAQAAGGLPAGHPPHNIPPNPSYDAACAHERYNSPKCITKAIAAIDHARSLEHVRPMILPDNFTTLTYAEQTFVATNLERVGRGLRPFRGITARLNQTAQKAAVADADPAPAYGAIGEFTVMNYQSNWTSNFGPLAGDYGWMYDDGYGSYNIDCPSPSSSGCWAHRDIILTRYTGQTSLISGVGSDKQNGLLSIAQLFVAGKGQHPTFTYTWRQALRHGADGHHS
jgi:hypothetical protein